MLAFSDQEVASSYRISFKQKNENSEVHLADLSKINYGCKSTEYVEQQNCDETIPIKLSCKTAYSVQSRVLKHNTFTVE